MIDGNADINPPGAILNREALIEGARTKRAGSYGDEAVDRYYCSQRQGARPRAAQRARLPVQNPSWKSDRLSQSSQFDRSLFHLLVQVPLLRCYSPLRLPEYGLVQEIDVQN